MAKIAAISLANLSIKNIKKKNLIHITNIVIFIALFAVSAAIISLFFEKKIEELNKKLSSEFGNEIIYSYWLSETPKNIRNIESLLSQISRDHSYLIYMQGVNDILITSRDLGHNPVIDLLRFNRHGIKYLEDSIKDAVLLSASTVEMDEIKKFKNKLNKIRQSFYSIEDKNKIRVISWEHQLKRMTNKEKKDLYKRALLAKSDLADNLNEIVNFNIGFNLNYFHKKKSDSQNKISKIKEEIKIASKKESRAILFAFIIQLLIFAIIQFFEFGFELTERIRKGKK